MSIEIRAAAPGDGALLHRVIGELARHHGRAADFTALPEDYERFLVDERDISGAFLAFWRSEVAGGAVWLRAYSTFTAQETVYLEDICVLEAFRRRGVGQALLAAVARLASAREAVQIDWLMMHWNGEARRFYEAAGAEIEEGNFLCSLSGEALERLAR